MSEEPVRFPGITPFTARAEVERIARDNKLTAADLDRLAASMVMIEACQDRTQKHRGEFHARCKRCNDSFLWKKYKDVDLGDGISGHPVCEECWVVMSPDERVKHFEGILQWVRDEEYERWRREYVAANRLKRAARPPWPKELEDRCMERVRAMAERIRGA
jgi:hypothetical protein